MSKPVLLCHSLLKPQLRQAVSQWYPSSNLDNVLITHGASEANLIATASVLVPGDELIFVIPNFMQIWGIARSLGMTVKTISLKEENGWQLDLDELRGLITPQTKAIAFSNPNNPTGMVFSQEIMYPPINRRDEFGQEVKKSKHQLFLISKCFSTKTGISLGFT